VINEDEKSPKDDSSREQEPQIFALTRDAAGYRLDRRGFLKAASLAVAAAALPSCSDKPQRPPGNKMLVADGNLDRLPRAHRSIVSSLSLSADGKLLASGGSGEVKLWALPEGKLISALSSPRTDLPSDVVTAFLSSDGKLLVSGTAGAGKGGAARFWSLPEVKELGNIESFAVAMSADGTILAGMDGRNSTALWSLPEGKKLATLGGVESSYSKCAVVFSADGKMLACVGPVKVIKLWTVPPAKKEFKTLIGHKDDICALCLSSDGKLLASGDMGKLIKLWSLPEGRELATMEVKSRVYALSFSGDGKLLASGHGDGSIRLWEAPTGTLLATFNCGRESVESIALSADARFLFASTYKGRIFLWELEGAKRCWVLFDPDTEGQTKVSCYDDREKVMAGAVCTCDMVCTCNTVWVQGRKSLPRGAVCVCDTIMVGKPGKTDAGGSRGGGHYWRPS